MLLRCLTTAKPDNFETVASGTDLQTNRTVKEALLQAARPSASIPGDITPPLSNPLNFGCDYGTLSVRFLRTHSRSRQFDPV